MASSSDSESYTGSCMCRAVQFTIDAAPKMRYLCHCPHCKKASGSVFMHNFNFPADAVTYTSGASSIRTWEDTNTGSGTPLERSFCSNCGSPLSIRTQLQPGRIMITAGTLNGDVQEAVPESESWGRERVGWVGFVAAKQMGGGRKR